MPGQTQSMTVPARNQTNVTIEFIETGETAKSADQRNDIPRAINLYEKALELGQRALRISETQPIHARSIREVTTKFHNRLQELRALQSQRQNGSMPSSSSNARPKAGSGTALQRSATRALSYPTKQSTSAASGQSALRRTTTAGDTGQAPAKARAPLTDIEREVLNTVLDKSPSVAWDDIIGLEEPKQCLLEMVVLPSLNPGVFSGLRTPPKGLLLFGPPGNGKTFIAKAVASQCNATFFSCSSSTLTSKWHGEGEKICKALFSIARKAQPSVIFMDEVDSLLSARGGSHEHDSSRRLKTEFLVQFDGAASSEDDRVVVLGATNRPFDLDDAVLRRFTKRIFIPLPCGKSRTHLVKHLLAKNGYNISDYELREVIRETEGYSASDLTSLCREASLVALREIDPAKIANVTKEQIRPMNVKDFKLALRKIRPSCSKEGLIQLERWNSQFGS